MNLLHWLLGQRADDDEIVAQKGEEARMIKNQIHNDIVNIANRINTVNTESHNQIKELTKRLNTISEQIAIATGGKRRGL